MNIKEVTFKDEAREGILRGINILADAVSSTLGAEGKTVVLEDANGKPKITKDGVTVSNSIYLENPIENIGATLVKETASKTVDSVGDGTSSSVVLAREIISLANKEINNGVSPVLIKKDIDRTTKKVIELLKKSAIPVTDESLNDVAIISANNDEDLGKLIADAFRMSGENGLVMIGDSDNEATYIDRVEGMSLDKGFDSNLFVTNEEKQVAVLEKPLILILDTKLDRIDDIYRFLELAMKENRAILIVGELEDKIVGTLAVNKARGKIKVCVVKPSMFGERKREMLQDIAVATGGIMISDETGDNIDALGLECLGEAIKAEIYIDNTVLVLDIDKNGENIEDRVINVKKRLKASENEVEKRYLKDRVSKLSGGVSVIKVGGYSPVEQKERKDRVDDAVHAVKASKKEGIISGGGLELLLISKELEMEIPTVGEKVLLDAIKMPFKQILLNGGYNPNDYIDKVSKGFGVDVKTGNIVNMMEVGIIDPVKVTRTALENANSVAGTVLLTDTVVSIAREKK